MSVNARDVLRRLGAGERIADVCQTLGMTRDEFDRFWRDECRRRVPRSEGRRHFHGLRGRAQIIRDCWGIPTVRADNDADLFFGFGYATAQDRLFQLDYLRRKARGRLAEVLGPEAVASDTLYRTLDLAMIAERELDHTPRETRELLTAYSEGVNAFLVPHWDLLPIEFDLLDYRPESWKPADSLAILGEFRWYLTGRFPVIVIPELVKRALGDAALYRAFLQGEQDDESILWPGEYERGSEAPGVSAGGDPGAGGSNNWVLAGERTTTGRPLVANDPHIPLAAVSAWQEVVLDGGSFHVAGAALAGAPAVMAGRNRDVAWGITNNICSQRDLYLEKTDPAHPGCFLTREGTWKPERRREEVIQVRGAEPVRLLVRASHNGPIVDDVLPKEARGVGPVSLRWLGAEPCGWLTAMLGMDRASNTAELREATQPWLVPTFNLVFADREGHIGHHCAGRIPLRRVAERGYRPGWDPAHQWDGLIPFETMPHLKDPPRGFVITANNRLAPDDFTPPLSGTWSSGHRGRRIREMIEATPGLSRQDCQALHADVRSNRAVQAVPYLAEALAGSDDERVKGAADSLRAWGGDVRADSVPAAMFNVFFTHWCRRVMAERVPGELVDLAAPSAGGLALRLLTDAEVPWFKSDNRAAAIRETMRAALAELERRLGPDSSRWQWGRLHALLQKHFLSGRGDLGELLDRSGAPADGDATTVNATPPDAEYRAYLGAGYRMVADFADARPGLWSIEVGSASGHPGSPHYDDQLGPWLEGKYHYLPLDGPTEALTTLELVPLH